MCIGLAYPLYAVLPYTYSILRLSFVSSNTPFLPHPLILASHMQHTVPSSSTCRGSSGRRTVPFLLLV